MAGSKLLTCCAWLYSCCADTFGFLFGVRVLDYLTGLFACFTALAIGRHRYMSCKSSCRASKELIDHGNEYLERTRSKLVQV